MSPYWLHKPEPHPSDGFSAGIMNNIALRKYLRWIHLWGGWRLFQELLEVLDHIAAKHTVPLSAVAMRWVLEQSAVAAVVVGVRMGYRDHLRDNQMLFTFSLDKQDLAAIAEVQSRGRDLYTFFGDCGGEFRLAEPEDPDYGIVCDLPLD